MPSQTESNVQIFTQLYLLDLGRSLGGGLQNGRGGTRSLTPTKRGTEQV